MMQASVNSTTKKPLKRCDLVMKGGITSGIVYPPAIIKLKEYYRFHHIGGTSAGAIAAAFTAAAEFNRRGGGFDEIENLCEWLGKDNNLRDLFQASPQTQPLMDIVNVLLDRPQNGGAQAGGTGSTVGVANGSAGDAAGTSLQVKKPGTLRMVKKLAWALIPKWRNRYSAYNRGASWGMRVGISAGVFLGIFLSLIVFTILSLVNPADWLRNLLVMVISIVMLGGILGFLGSWLVSRIGGLLGAFVGIINILTKEMPQAFYGVCPGHTEGVESPTVLTDWLHASLEKVAGPGREGPLTFGQLSKKKVELMMVTTNLSHGQPYIMPSGLQNFVYNENHMSALFPKDIVDHMKKHPPARTILPKDKRLPDGFYFLPDEEFLPVLLCTRMSLSFPLLLGAVPLYTIRSSALQKGKGASSKLETDDLQINWFSDGGLCSNFPIQFFDAWLPRYPTFGIDLITLPKEMFEDGSQQTAAVQAEITPANGYRGTYERPRLESFSALDMRDNRSAVETNPPPDVYLPRPEDLQDPQWDLLTSLPQFLVAIFKTAQNYRDNLQASLPSYRERVVQIRLQRNEGGLNLNMPPETIAAIVDKGQRAGEVLHNDFNFEHHWWVRFLVLMAQLEIKLESMEVILATPGFEKRLEQEVLSLQYPYCRDKAWCDEAIKRIAELRKTIAAWGSFSQTDSKPLHFSKDAPLPKPVLRVTPEI